MSPIRRAVIFVISTAMIAGGCWLLYEQFTVSRTIYGWALMTGGMLITIGLALLWQDLIAPLLTRKA